jgi:hypothetical protein
VLQINENGELASDFDITFAISGSLHTPLPPFPPGVASVSARLWIFPFDGVESLAQARFPMNNARYYTEFFESTSGLSQNLEIGSLDGLEPVSKFWIYGVLGVETGAVLNFAVPNTISGTYEAKYGNTVRLFIDPDPANPNATYSTASGQSYLTTVPVPLSFALACSAALVLLACGGMRQKVVVGGIRSPADGGV